MKVHVGDLFFNYTDGTTQAVRLTPNNLSKLPTGKLVTEVERFSVSSQLYGQETLSEYTTKLRVLGVEPFNTYSMDSQLSDNVTSLAKVTSASNFSDISFLDPSFAPSNTGLTSVLTVVKIAKTDLKKGAGTISLTLECGNDFIEIDIPPLLIETAQEIIPDNQTTVIEPDIEPLAETDGNTLEITLGSAVMVGLVLLLLGGDNNSVSVPVIPPVVPVIPPVVPTVVPSEDVNESGGFPYWLLLFLTRKNRTNV